MSKESQPSTAPIMRFQDITVIVHGPVLAQEAPGAPQGMTLAAVQSVRKILPGAKVLISTWAGSATEGLGADAVVRSPDPGSLPYAPKERPNNVNRQIVAMRAGLELVDTRFVLKLRSDTMLISDGMMRQWGRFQARNPHLRVFEERVITSAFLTYHPRICFQGGRFTPFLFHVNDMIQFGLAADMRKLWTIPLMPAAEFTYFKESELEGKVDKVTNRRVPEDYIWTSALTAAGFSSNDSWADFRPELIPVSELSIVNNFHLLDQTGMGFLCLKYPEFARGHHLIDTPYFTPEAWLELYRLHCDPTVPLPPRPPLLTGAKITGILRSMLRVHRLGAYLKRTSRPARHRVKEALRSLRLWK